MNGRSIRLYFPDRDPSGLFTAEVMNWSGKMLIAPRSRLADLAKREEVTRTGIYILAGPDPENPMNEIVYIGEGDNVMTRLVKHNKDESKDFWTRCVSVISKDLNLTKAHVRYLESRLIALGYAAGRAKIHNNTAPAPTHLPEADLADMEGFLEHIELTLPVIGFSFLKPKPTVNRPDSSEPLGDDESPLFEFACGEAKATAKEVDGEFVVLKGSTATLEPRASWTSYRKLRQQLVDEKKLVEVSGQGLLLFAEDVYLASPSAGASIVAAGNSNGPSLWKTADTRQTYRDWKQSQLPSEVDE